VTDRKHGRILFDRPKPTVGCSASGRRRRNNNDNYDYNVTTKPVRSAGEHDISSKKE
jgi:hypothetical protein